MRKIKKAVALGLSLAMATSGVQLTGLGDLEVKAAGNISRVSVHDPSIFAENGKYYVFGSHIATASSEDLVNWKQVSTDYQDVTNNVIYGNVKENLAESFKWAGYDDGDCAGGNYAVWAPDVIYNPSYVWEDGSKGAYMLYYSASSTWRRSCIGYMVSKRFDGDYQYGGTVVYSGFTNTGKVNYDGNSTRDTTWTKDYLPFNKLIEEGKIDGDASTWKCFNADGSWNNNYAPNAIDPTLFFDAAGKHLYMVYGSWSGGLFILEIDKETGEAIYPGQDGIEETSGNYVDRYFGVHIAGGNHQSGEGPYIEYDKNTGYYYMYETYGGLTTTGGYNMRLFRSKNVYGPYVDPAGNEAGGSGVDCYKYGAKLIGNYQFYGQPGYRAAGHNSAMVTDDGKYYLFYHQRFLDSSVGEYHEVRVRQQFLNEDDWLVTAVYENRNEQIQKYTEDDVVGSYEFINHGNAEKDGSMLSTQTVNLNSDGTISGDKEGTWTMADAKDYTYVTLNLEGAVYKGVFFQQTNDNEEKTMTFTAIGNNNQAVWGSKFEQSDDMVVGKIVEQLKSTLPGATREDISLPTSLSGAEISWESNTPSVISNTGKASSPKEDTTVTLTATITYGSTSISQEYQVLVYNSPRIIVGYGFDEVSGDTVSASAASIENSDAVLKGTASVVEDEVRGKVLKVENAKGNKQVNYLSLPANVFQNVDEAGYTVSMWVNVGESTWEHSALFEGDWLADGATTGTYPMTRIGANLIGRINANDYSDAVPGLNYGSLTGKWQLVTYTVATNGIKVYLDGNMVVYDKKDITNCFSGKNAAIQNVNHVMVGAGDIWTDEDCRDALFDDIRIYDTALTASEVSKLYDATYKEKKEIKPEEPEETNPDEEEPEVEGMTKVYIQLKDEQFAEGAYLYGQNENGDEIFGEKPGKKMANIGNGWYSVNVPEDILYSEEKAEKDFEASENDETVEAEAAEEVVAETDSEEGASDAQEESLLDEVKEVVEKVVAVITSAFNPMVVRAEGNQFFADGVTLSVNNGSGYELTAATALFTTTRPTEEQLKKAEETTTETEKKEEPEKQPETTGDVKTETEAKSEPASRTESQTQQTTTEQTSSTNTSSTSGSSSSSGSSDSSASSATGTTVSATDTTTASIADTQVPAAASKVQTASTTTTKTASSKKVTVNKTESADTSDGEVEIEADSNLEDVETVEETKDVTESVAAATEESETKAIEDEEPAQAAPVESTSNGMGIIMFIIIAILAVAGCTGVCVYRKKNSY